MSKALSLPRSLAMALGALWLALVGAWVVPPLIAGAQVAPVNPPATAPGNPCTTGAPVKTFAVSLIHLPIFLNRFGDVVPNGRMYVLDENVATARATFTHAADPFNPKDIIEPLVLRVNRGDCVEVTFTNRLNEVGMTPFVRDDAIYPLPGETFLKTQPGAVTPQPRTYAPSAVQPVVIQVPAPASMHFTGLSFDVKGSDGTAVGNNPSSVVAPGGTTLYRLHADREGQFRFYDGADLMSGEAENPQFIGSAIYGSYGAIVVEPPGATWLDVNTGLPLKSGTRAVVVDPAGPDHREHVIFINDEAVAVSGIVTPLCLPGAPLAPLEPCVTATPDQVARLQAGALPAFVADGADALINGEVPVSLGWFVFNYRSEPLFNREEVGCPAQQAPYQTNACVGEETDLSSWPYGDPGAGDLVFHNYRGEPMKIRLLHGAGHETHPFHWHIHRWPKDPADENGLASIAKPRAHTHTTNPLDVQSLSPGAEFLIIPEGGAGSAHDLKPATFGDVIFHCHLYPHFAEGLWGLTRVHDVREDGTRTLPDGTPILNLVPLPDFPAPPAPTASKPGFPFFMPAQFGYKAPKPPLGVPERQATGVLPPTQLELSSADADAKKPGAFFKDPCPTTRSDGKPTPLKVFDVAAIQLDATYNQKLGWHNPQHRMYVLQEHKADVLAGRRAPEPFSPLLNVGDCVEFRLTNELPTQFGGTVFDRLQPTREVGIHQHLVQFDVLTSDGAANGWNYDGGADPGQTIVYRDFVSEDIVTNSFHDHFYPAMSQDNGLFGGSTVHPYGCTFHDPTTGLPVKVGTMVDVRCTPAKDYHGAGTDGRDYRSAALFIEDHVPLFKPHDPSNPAEAPFVTPHGVPIYPGRFPSQAEDWGVDAGINYRLEPFEGRRKDAQGNSVDPASVFSSRVWGDPFTPIPKAYAGDRIRFNLFQLSMEHSHGFNMHRWRWKEEPNDAESNVVQAQHISMLEYFVLDVPVGKEEKQTTNDKPLRDYLYFYGGAEDLFLGAWGIFRIFECNAPGLSNPQALPDNPVGTCTPPAKPPVANPGIPCPAERKTNAITAPIRRYNVVAINKDVVYNHAGDHDPHGVMFALQDDLAAIQSGAKQPEPLVIRANAGDCVEVTLTNQLDPARMQPHCFESTEAGHIGFITPQPGITTPDQLAMPGCLLAAPTFEYMVPGWKPFPVSSRVSMNAQMVDYQIGSDGAAVGYNVDSSVGPGQSILYRWYTPQQGIGLIQDRADVQNHLHHGLYGAIVVEPAGSTYLNPRDGTPLLSGQEAVIVDPSGADFREFVVLMNSDLSLFRSNGFPVPDNIDLAINSSREAEVPTDLGEVSIGYRNEPWVHRFLRNPDLSLVFSSVVHGDPATPVFQAYAGDPVRFRVAQATGKARSTSFTLHGHRWRHAPLDPQSELITTQGQFNPGVAYNVQLDPAVHGGAGGPMGFSGDYLYRSNSLLRHMSGGQWGILRVHPAPAPGTAPQPGMIVKLPDRP